MLFSLTLGRLQPKNISQEIIFVNHIYYTITGAVIKCFPPLKTHFLSVTPEIKLK